MTLAVRAIMAILVALTVGTQYTLWGGKDGVIDLWRLQRAVDETRTENLALHERNQAFMAEVVDLKTGNQAIEERARSGLGMIKSGETFFQVIDKPVNH